MKTLFISDLHLTPSRPDITDCFIQFMRDEAPQADAVYVLGDLFEFWIGDDDTRPFAKQIRDEFKQLTEKGIPCFFSHGNRDFLVGKRFSRQTGVQLLDEEAIIDLYGRKALVMHGDTLCTDDVKYLAYREKVHQPWLQWVFNRIPFFLKKKIVGKVQSDIKDEKKDKSLDIMDVNQSAVESTMKRHGVELLIHGHTHRPDIHTFTYGEEKMTRIVLGDWYEQGSVLEFTGDDFSLQARAFSSNKA
ncbi:UDP-2,3-diacylglucosamine diphosphatase [Vibrio maerlii]|uniref:UDP-2,3-diacylglucosamine diphosphatase n=1 Tax=Vibrio maerlii TaxID=2231648 RepID=UPI000E3BC07E|nr:UDP-2,3-diacylglucosamine diphosphatase [Vibrio maerlii]